MAIYFVSLFRLLPIWFRIFAVGVATDSVF
jgi:hypothetical protein